MPCPEELFCGEPLSYWLADQTKDHRGQPRQEVDLAAELLAAQRSPLLVNPEPKDRPGLINVYDGIQEVRRRLVDWTDGDLKDGYEDLRDAILDLAEIVRDTE